MLDIKYCLLCFLSVTLFLGPPQALELARSVQSQRDLGCQASQVVHLEEGVNCDDSLAEDFWRLLGGRRQYRGPPCMHLFQFIIIIRKCSKCDLKNFC